MAAILFALFSIASTPLAAQGTAEDYARAYSLAERYKSFAPTTVERAEWMDDSHQLRLQLITPGDTSFLLIDADKRKRSSLTAERWHQLISSPSRPPYAAGRYWGERDEERTGDPVTSPDGKYSAFIRNSNLFIRAVDSQTEKQLSFDGAPGEYYSARILWSPDSRHLALTKIRPAEKQFFYMIESSPREQLQPKLHQREYAKPGDALPQRLPCIFSIEGEALIPSNELFPQQYELNRLAWDSEGRAITFEYNQRGHQLYRLLELSLDSRRVRTLIEEKSNTFVNYRRYFRQDLADSNRILWMSERDNYNHLYLYDRQSASVVQQITRGEWYVRDILHVDEEQQLIWFSANGMNDNEDPYYLHYYRIRFDGTDLIDLTPEPGNHFARFSKDMQYLIDTRSTVDSAPITLLRGADGEPLMTLAEGDLTPLKQEGWIAPEPFTAKGRDGETDIWGVIFRPSNFDPNRTYPVIEYIYAGPGSAYTPKSFNLLHLTHRMIAELGFIVVQCDGMGTSFRSKAFEEVCYKNLKDAGFPDRIAWIKAAAEKYPYIDTTRVGIFGASAGGQEAMGALLFHGDFYTAAYSSCGCHDNRMDKIWWNEQWMGYPVDDSYVACSNVANAHLLSRPLMLVVGELDDNVDPASTLQVVDALIRAGKEFELVVLPGVNHTLGGSYGDRKRFDFFVRHLHGVTPPDWNITSPEEIRKAQ